jgi:hypothetical protein
MVVVGMSGRSPERNGTYSAGTDSPRPATQRGASGLPDTEDYFSKLLGKVKYRLRKECSIRCCSIGSTPEVSWSLRQKVS